MGFFLKTETVLVIESSALLDIYLSHDTNSLASAKAPPYGEI